MLGWEFPPFFSGGLGVACYGFTKALSKKGVEVIFVLPVAPEELEASNLKVLSAKDFTLKGVKIRTIGTTLYPYVSAESYAAGGARKPAIHSIYGSNLFQEVLLFAQRIKEIARKETFDVIHAHDWLTFLAGIEAKKVSGKPLIVHLHALEYDRTGGNNMNPFVMEIERAGLREADHVIANSEYTKQNALKFYGGDPGKIFVVHNAIDQEYGREYWIEKPNKKIVMFFGRVTLQKGPEYFLQAAKKVLEHRKDVEFVFAGTGDMLPRMIDLAIDLGIADKVHFTGFVKGEPEASRLYKMAHVYVMPSVSEPFGINLLESMACGTPAVVSRQNGLAQKVRHCLKADFWDIDDMAGKILALLSYNPLHFEVKRNALQEVKEFSWGNSAEELIKIYSRGAR